MEFCPYNWWYSGSGIKIPACSSWLTRELAFPWGTFSASAYIIWVAGLKAFGDIEPKVPVVLFRATATLPHLPQDKLPCEAVQNQLEKQQSLALYLRTGQVSWAVWSSPPVRTTEAQGHRPPKPHPPDCPLTAVTNTEHNHCNKNIKIPIFNCGSVWSPELTVWGAATLVLDPWILIVR